jgi:glycosyltransferase involved in cell wall biosynthesis
VARSRLKILYVSRGYTTHDRRFMMSFAAEGWQVAHLPMVDERLDERPLPAQVDTLRWTPDLREPATSADWIEREQRLRTILSDVSPDVVIAGPVQSGAYLAALAGASPLVTVSWGTDMLVDADRNAQLRMATSYTLDRSDAVFGDCRAVREAVKRHAGMPDECIVTFPWGIDLDRFTPGASALPLRLELEWEDCEVFISTRTWEPVYAIDVMVEAFALVHAERPAARLILLGDGSRRNEIHASISDHALGSAVYAPGRVSYETLPDYFRTSDVYVSSALSDGTSVSLLEAMATGLPVVVGDSYGNLEWVEAGVNGELARPGDAESLAEAMISVIADPPRAGRMGESNVAVARDRADWSKNFPKLARLVEELAS